MLKHLLVSLLLTICVVGCQTKSKVIYSTFTQDPKITGLIRIAEDKDINCTIDGNQVKLYLGGYYAVHKTDIEAFIEMLNKGN